MHLVCQHWFLDLTSARWIIEDWRIDDNHVRPHSSMGYRTPQEVYWQLIRSFDGFELADASEQLDQLTGAGQSKEHAFKSAGGATHRVGLITMKWQDQLGR
jgi:hypothetical protein